MGALLSTVTEAVQGSLRLRVEGRSTGRGSVPKWLRDASRLRVRVSSGSTVVSVNCPPLIETDHEVFRQPNLVEDFPDPKMSAFELFQISLQAAVKGGTDVEDPGSYDDGLLRTFGKIDPIFEHGVDLIDIGFPDAAASLGGRNPIRLTKNTKRAFESKRRALPSPRRSMVVGVLNEIRSDNLTFRLATGDGILKGSAKKSERKTLQELWGKSVLAEGVVSFGNGGFAQHMEAEYLRPSTDHDEQLIRRIPVSTEKVPLGPRALLRQGPRSGINAILGSWPGEESDEEFEAILDELQEIRREP